jgi:hypothetical protein
MTSSLVVSQTMDGFVGFALDADQPEDVQIKGILPVKYAGKY